MVVYLLILLFVTIANSQCADINTLPDENTGFRALTYNLEGWKSRQDGFSGIKKMLLQLQNKNVDIMGFQEADQGGNNGIKSTLEGMGMYEVLFQDPPGVALYANRRWKLAGGQNIPIGNDAYWTRYLNVAVLRNENGDTINVGNMHGCLEPTHPYDYGCQSGLMNAFNTANFFSDVSRSIFTCDCNDYSNVIRNGGSNSLNGKGMTVIDKPCGGLAYFDWIAAGSQFKMRQRYTFGGQEWAYTSDHSALLVDFDYSGSPPGPAPPTPKPDCDDMPAPVPENPSATCGERWRWLVNNQGKSENDAKCQVKQEEPRNCSCLECNNRLIASNVTHVTNNTKADS